MFLGLPNPASVQVASEGPDGIVAGLSKGKIWVDHSTTDHNQSVTFRGITQEKGASVSDATITGGIDALKWVALALLVQVPGVFHF